MLLWFCSGWPQNSLFVQKLVVVIVNKHYSTLTILNGRDNIFSHVGRQVLQCIMGKHMNNNVD